MKKIALLTLLISSLCFSQNSVELEGLNEILKSQKISLLEKKIDIENQINDIDIKIELNNSKIEIQKLKRSATKTLLKRNCNFYKNPSANSEIIDSPKSNSNIYLIEYYKYGTYFKAIYNDKIGYIQEKNIRRPTIVKELKLKKKGGNKYSNSLKTNNTTKSSYTRKSYSKSYYKGPRGGCYYINSKGNKSYVSRSLCN
jgi:glycerol dehydrogenase-like iron-containing ADH family enzyme